MEIRCLIRYPFRKAREGRLRTTPTERAQLRVVGQDNWRDAEQMPVGTVIELDHLDPDLEFYALAALHAGWTVQVSGRPHAGAGEGVA
ncbi:MAG: hypothetical protein M3Q65_01945 [Chloroflexota bacterium]|nr:hypothetical protein [Chloroflexota bacterium]